MLVLDRRCRGWTLMELLVVIAILLVLCAVAIPRLLDLSSAAKEASVEGIAAALSTANADNYNLRSRNPSAGIAISNCTDVAQLLPSDETLPSDYSITTQAITVGQTVDCTLNGLSNTTATFTATGIN